MEVSTGETGEEEVEQEEQGSDGSGDGKIRSGNEAGSMPLVLPNPDQILGCRYTWIYTSQFTNIGPSRHFHKAETCPW